jgi:hypothetical protein
MFDYFSLHEGVLNAANDVAFTHKNVAWKGSMSTK